MKEGISLLENKYYIDKVKPIMLTFFEVFKQKYLSFKKLDISYQSVSFR